MYCFVREGSLPCSVLFSLLVRRCFSSSDVCVCVCVFCHLVFSDVVCLCVRMSLCVCVLNKCLCFYAFSC